MKKSKKITIPTCLTLVRLIGAPVLVPFFIVHYVSQNDVIMNVFIVTLFLFFGFTDFLDGYFARRYAQTSELGATLDHLADKFLTFSAFIALLAIHRISYIWVLLLIGRELYVMGLREIALEHAMSIHVASFGKLKTCMHIALIAWMIINPAYQEISFFWNGIEALLLVGSLFLSLYSAFYYSIVFYAQFLRN